MNRKQRALEERYKNSSQCKGKSSFLLEKQEREYREAQIRFELKRKEEEWYEQNREATLEDVIKYVNDYFNRTITMTGVWSYNYEPPKREAEIRDIFRYIKDKMEAEFTGNKYCGTYMFEYSPEYISCFREKAIAEFKRRQSPLYKLL